MSENHSIPRRKGCGRRTSVSGGIALFAVLALAGCGGTATSPSSDDGETTGDDTVSVGLVTSIAGLGDRGFNDLAAAGVQCAEDEFGATGDVVEAEAQTDYVPNLQGFADGGTDLVFAVGFLMQDALTEVAPQNPETKFAIIDAVVEEPNVASITFREEQGSFLAGVFAAEMTKAADTGDIPGLEGTGILGFIGGGDVPLIHKFQEGFEQGVAAVDPEIKVLTSYAGSFTDPATGKELALSQYQSGADIIFQAAGPTGTGVIEAAEELNRYVIGVDADQNQLAPDNVITSMLKNVDVAVCNMIETVANGDFTGGQTVLGVAEDGVGLAPFHSLAPIVPTEVEESVAQYKEQLAADEVEVTLSPAAGG